MKYRVHMEVSNPDAPGYPFEFSIDVRTPASVDDLYTFGERIALTMGMHYRYTESTDE